MSDFGCHEPFDVGPCVTQTVRVCLRGPLDPIAIPALRVRTCSGGVLQDVPAFFMLDGDTPLPTYTDADVVDCPESVFDWGGGGGGGGGAGDMSLAKAELDEQKARADAALAERDSLKTELDELRKQRAKPPAAEVTRLQVKMALMSAGLLSQVEEFVSQADDMTKLAWNEASVFRRDSTVLVTLASSVGMTEQQLDELFALASTINV